MLDFATHTVHNPDKSRNGDHCLSAYLKSEDIMIIAVADGVSGAACDYKASRMACEGFVQFFQEYKGLPISGRCQQAVEATNSQLLIETGACQGLKSTLSVIVWPTQQHTAHFISIGDSRIFSVRNKEVQQVSIDDATTMIHKGTNGKVTIIAGTTVVARPITQCLGYRELEFSVKTIDTSSYDGFILTTDGIPNMPAALGTITEHPELSQALNTFCSSIQDRQNDDMSIAAIRRRPPEDESMNQEILRQIFNRQEVQDYSRMQLSMAITEGLKASISEGEIDNANNLLDFASQGRVVLPREKVSLLAEQLKAAVLPDGKLFRRLVALGSSI